MLINSLQRKKVRASNASAPVEDDLERGSASSRSVGVGSNRGGIASFFDRTRSAVVPAEEQQSRTKSDARMALVAALANPATVLNPRELFTAVMCDPLCLRYLNEFLSKEFSTENMLFWQEVQQFRSEMMSLSRFSERLLTIFVKEGAVTQVNIKAPVRIAIERAIATGNLSPFVFDDAQDEARILILALPASAAAAQVGMMQ